MRVRRALTLATRPLGQRAGPLQGRDVTPSAASSFRARRWRRPKTSWSSIAGYWPDIEKSRAEARRLLKEAGAEGLSFELLNRNVDQPYKYVGIWVIDQWSKIGVNVTQNVVPTGPWFAAQRSGDFEVLDRWQLPWRRQPGDRCPALAAALRQRANYGYYEDPKELDIYDKMLHETDATKQRALMLQFDKRVLDERRITSIFVVVEPPSAAALLRPRLEDRPEPLHQPGFGDDLAQRSRNAGRVVRTR